MNLSNLYTSVENLVKGNNLRANVEFKHDSSGVFISFTSEQTKNNEHEVLSNSLPYKNTIKIKKGRGQRKGLSYATILINTEITRLERGRIIEIKVV